MQPLFKWPGGKSSELSYIKEFIPSNFDRYVEPFLGGGAMFFDLEPSQALVNDVNPSLITAYQLLAVKDQELREQLDVFSQSREYINSVQPSAIKSLYDFFVSQSNIHVENNIVSAENCSFTVTSFFNSVFWPLFIENIPQYIEQTSLKELMLKSLEDKFKRLQASLNKGNVWKIYDIQLQLLTAVHAGLYFYVRSLKVKSKVEKTAQFLFLREFCYGGMFRFNNQGGFNVPYGGASYNDKSFKKKIDYWFSDQVSNLLNSSTISNLPFNDFVDNFSFSEQDFVFLDPPYDSVFKDYDQFVFAKEHQQHLRDWFMKTGSQALIIIGKTDLIESLYQEAQKHNSHITIESYDKQYAYNIKGRNNRSIEHLAIRNY